MFKNPNICAELQEELSDQPLEVSGKIPLWLLGTLVRNGPITVALNGELSEHWFDAFHAVCVFISRLLRLLHK